MSVLAVEVTPRDPTRGTWWGMQLDFELAGRIPGLVRDQLTLHRWVQALVKKIGMTAYGQPRAVHFGEGDLAGWTIEQLITTSNITAHFNDDTNSALITVFSCQEFDPDIAIAFTVSVFGAAAVTATVRHRYIPALVTSS
jgi:S-adenosylmethionine/arginine decarboxylase-like enzyme